MQKLAEICIRRPVFAAMIVLSLVVVGSASYFKLGVDRFPSVDLPKVSVRTNLPGASPEEIETLVSQPIEEVVNTVDGIDNLRSVSVQGSSIVIATFNLNRDIDTAAQDVRDRVATVVRDLPPDTKPPVIAKFNNDSTAVVTVALSGDRSIRELTEYADKVVKVQLERAGGVGEVDVVGGLNRAINVWIDAQRLAAYKIPITKVRDALQRQNADVPGGNVETDKRELVLRTLGRYTDPREMEDLVVANINSSPVRIRDIGRVEDGTKEQRSVARLNDVPTVTLEVRRQSGANTVEVIHNVKAQLQRVSAQLPSDIKLEIIRDQERYIGAALHEITRHLVLGSILASLVVLLFMRSWRSTLIAAIAIPCSVISTFAMMRAMSFTLNGVTMLALVLMVGVVIDDAIVVLENIFRFVEEKRMSAMRAAKEATADIGLAVMATTFSLVVIFLPVSFMSSISGRFLFQFGITAAVAVLVSLLVSFTLTPMMSARLIQSSAGGSFLGAVNQASIYVRIAPHDERVFSLTKLWSSIKAGHPLAAWRGNYTQRDVMQEVRDRLQKYAPFRCNVRNAPSFNIGGGNFEIDFVFRGPELEALAKYAETLREKTKEIGGIVDADTTLKLDKPELRVHINRDRTADLGVDTADISTALRLMVGGDDRVSRFRDPSVNEDYDVELRLSEPDRKDTATISRLYVPSSRGGLVRVDNLVDIKEEASPSRIDRLDRQRQASMRAGVAPGFALADRLDALRKAAAAMNLPVTYSTIIAGRGRELERTFVEFLWAFLLSIIFMYMILASQFESTIHPFTILLSLPFSVPFALLSLWLLGDTLNLYSALGILVF